MKHFSNHKIDHRSKKSMLAYLDRHPEHADTPWVEATIANCIKLSHLPIPRDISDSAYEYLYPENFEWGFELSTLIADFEKEYGCKVYQSGRSGGWLELHKQGQQSVFSSFDPPLSEESPVEDIRDLCILAEAFDRFCDEAFEFFLLMVRTFQEDQQIEKEEAERELLALQDCPFPMTATVTL